MCENPIKMIHPHTKEEIIVKCGKCIICRRNKCREWAIKLYNEGLYHKKMCMVTLTFRPKFLLRPKSKTLKKIKTKTKAGERIKTIIEEETTISPIYITNVKLTGWLITLFLKKLRKKLDKQNIKFSYFAVGEHGTQNTHRAHWHILFFGFDKNDINGVSTGKSKKNKEIYFSPIIDELWNYEEMSIGLHTISDVTTNTIKYVANYTMKKIYNNKNKYPTTMRFSNQAKIGIKFARRFHRELRKGYLKDNDGIKYKIPNQYLKEMQRYQGQPENIEKDVTAAEIEMLKDEMIIKLRKKGLLKKEEIVKKAKRLKNMTKRTERDTF